MKREKFSLMVHLIPDYLRTNIKIPLVQRDPNVWGLEQKQSLIDSLYNDFDIPKIYLRKKNTDPNTWWLIDGQQRLTTISEFLRGDFPIWEVSTIPLNLQGKKFKKLHRERFKKISSRI